MPIRFLAVLVVSAVCACSPIVGNQTEASPLVEYRLSELDRHEFAGLEQLLDIIRGQKASANIFDLEGNQLEEDLIKRKCGDISGPFVGYVIVNDGDSKMLKRYRIENLCAETLRPAKDFGYKNPYQ